MGAPKQNPGRRPGNLLVLAISVVFVLTLVSLGVAVGLDLIDPGRHVGIVNACLDCFKAGFVALLALVSARAMQ